MLCFVVLILATVNLNGIHGCAYGWSFDHKKYLRSNVVLEWTYDDDYITMAFTAPSTKWIGIGFSPQGVMTGSDIIIAGWKHGKGYILDTYAKKSGPPVVDEQQDVEAIHYLKTGFKTSVVMRRKRENNDKNDRDIKPGKTTIIWAYGFLDDIFSKPTYLNYHFERKGRANVELIPKYDEYKAGMKYPDFGKEEEDHPSEHQSGKPENYHPSKYPSGTSSSYDKYEYKQREAYLSHGVELEWRHTGEYITFEFTAPTVGWVGFGFSPGEDMVGADMIIGGYEEFKSDKYLYDTYGTKNGVPKLKKEKNVELLRVTQKFFKTTIVVRRKLDTGDDRGMPITAGEMNIIWAYGGSDILSAPSLFNYHLLNRGSKRVKLLYYKPTDSPIDHTDMDGYYPETPSRPPETTPTEIYPTSPWHTSKTYSTPTAYPVNEGRFVFLGMNSEIFLTWSFTDTMIKFVMTAPTQGWVGLGFNNVETLGGTDIVMASQDNASTVVMDAYASQQSHPLGEISQDWRIEEFKQGEDLAQVTLRRPIRANDSNDFDFAAYRGKYLYVFWAYGSKDLQQQLAPDNYSHGENRGSRKIFLY